MNFIRLTTLLTLTFAILVCPGCIPVPVPGVGFVNVPISEIISHEIEDRRYHKKSALEKAVSGAIARDDVQSYKKKLQECGSLCPPEDSPRYGTRMTDAIHKHAWHVLAYQLSQVSLETRTRLLHRAGGRDYGGAQELVSTLIASGAKADGIALANGVLYCRKDMIRLLLEHGAKPVGRYSGNDDDDTNDVGSAKFSLLSLAAIVHCDPEISKRLVAHGADPHDIDPALENMSVAIDKDDPVAYEQAWLTCSRVAYCATPGWNAAPLLQDYSKATESGWVDTAIMANAWKVVSVQLKRATPAERNTLLSAASAYYPDRPELPDLLQTLGATADGSSWKARSRGAPIRMDIN